MLARRIAEVLFNEPATQRGAGAAPTRRAARILAGCFVARRRNRGRVVRPGPPNRERDRFAGRARPRRPLLESQGERRSNRPPVPLRFERLVGRRRRNACFFARFPQVFMAHQRRRPGRERSANRPAHNGFSQIRIRSAQALLRRSTASRATNVRACSTVSTLCH